MKLISIYDPVRLLLNDDYTTYQADLSPHVVLMANSLGY